MQIITYNNKQYKIPFALDLKTDENKVIEVANMFTGKKVNLPWFAVAVYDMIMGAQQYHEYDLVQKGLDWFRKYFTKEYMVILD